MFSTCSDNFLPFSSNLKSSSANSFSLEESKILSSGDGIKTYFAVSDDGKISWEEFVGFFADGVMGKEELRTLFDEIDTHNTK